MTWALLTVPRMYSHQGMDGYPRFSHLCPSRVLTLLHGHVWENAVTEHANRNYSEACIFVYKSGDKLASFLKQVFKHLPPPIGLYEYPSFSCCSLAV